MFTTCMQCPHISWNWSYGWVWATLFMLQWIPGPLEEQPMFLQWRSFSSPNLAIVLTAYCVMSFIPVTSHKLILRFGKIRHHVVMWLSWPRTGFGSGQSLYRMGPSWFLLSKHHLLPFSLLLKVTDLLPFLKFLSFQKMAERSNYKVLAIR